MTQNQIRAIVALGVVAVIALGGYALFHRGPSFSGAGAYEALQTWFGNGIFAGSNKQLTIDNAGNISTTGTYSANGATTTTTRSALTTSTTTPCAVQSPAATSTLDRFVASFITSSTTASTVTIAKASTQYATTTVIATSSIAASAQATIVAATTTPVADSAAGRLTITDRTFAPSTWVVMSMTGGIGTFSPTGACIASFKSTT
jgi:hypothetical protein